MRSFDLGRRCGVQLVTAPGWSGRLLSSGMHGRLRKDRASNIYPLTCQSLSGIGKGRPLHCAQRLFAEANPDTLRISQLNLFGLSLRKQKRSGLIQALLQRSDKRHIA